ncbi:hypothetical protein Tco_0040754 [Tanacetum coccineum]
MNESIYKNEPHFTNPETLFAFISNYEYTNENNDSDDGVDENPQNKIHKWNKFMSFKPDIPDTPVYKSKPMISKQYSQQSEVKKGQIFDNKEALVLAVRLKALNDGFQFLVDSVAICVIDSNPTASREDLMIGKNGGFRLRGASNKLEDLEASISGYKYKSCLSHSGI